jgi:hypothetical protein
MAEVLKRAENSVKNSKSKGKISDVNHNGVNMPFNKKGNKNT